MSAGPSRVRELALTVGAVLGVCCLLAAVLGVGFGIRPLVFRSGSMGPGIPTGALGLARAVPAETLRPGDVVSVPTATGTRVTHRVVDVRAEGGGMVALTLRGDANAVADADPYLVRHADRLFWSAPRLGYAVSALSSRPATFAGGLLCGVLAMVVVGRRGPGPGQGSDEEGEVEGSPDAGSDPDTPPRADPTADRAARRPPHPAGGPARIGVGLLVLVALLAPGSPTPAYAAWTDSGTASGTFRTVTVPTTTLGCTATATSVTFTWVAVTGASYSLVIRRTDGTVESTTPIAAGTTSYTASNVITAGTATISAVRYTGAWRSVPSNPVSFSLLALTCS